MPPPSNPSPQPNTFLNTVLNPHTNPTSNPTSSTPPRPVRAFNPHPTTFSATQRSLQARNKEYNVLGAGKKEKEAESYEQRQRREEAACILESTEMLIWWSSARNESIPQTRAHFQNIVLGIAEWDRDVVWREEWEVEESAGVGSPRSAKGKEKDRGKRRVSSGVGG